MRSSEEMGYAMYVARCTCARIEPVSWEKLGEFLQKIYVSEANAALEYLFEHGRISSYINAEQLARCGAEYRMYLAEKMKKEQR